MTANVAMRRRKQIDPRRIGANHFNPRGNHRLSLRCALGHSPQTILRTREFADFAKSFHCSIYSKIQFFAAVLIFSRPRRLRASEYTRTTGSVPDNR